MTHAEDLDLVPTETLVAAIERRFDAYILVVNRKVDSRDSEQDVYYSGGYISAIGLCEYAKSGLLHNHIGAPSKPKET